MRKPSAILSLIQRYSVVFTWIAIYLVFYLVSSSHQNSTAAFLMTNMAVVPMIVLSAFLRYFLIPRTLHKHRISFFLLSLILLSIESYVCTEVDLVLSTWLHDEKMLVLPPEVEAAIQRGENQRVFLHTKYVFLLLTTMAITTISWLLDERKRLNRMQREQRSRMELKYLRAQINPHFLFNALNCIYTLTLLQDEKAPDSVMKLSDMLRYVTDDCRSDLVPLQKEVAYIQNYIDFQRIRMEHQADIQLEVEMQNPAWKVPPMIFQPMVENSFKHSRIVDQPDGHIHISLRQEGKTLSFVADNSIPQLDRLAEDAERTGIGLQNVQQRLELLFGDNATLNTQVSETNYRIELCIKY